MTELSGGETSILSSKRIKPIVWRSFRVSNIHNVNHSSFETFFGDRKLGPASKTRLDAFRASGSEPTNLNSATLKCLKTFLKETPWGRADPGFWSGGPSGVLRRAENRGHSLKIACKLHDFEQILGKGMIRRWGLSFHFHVRNPGSGSAG